MTSMVTVHAGPLWEVQLLRGRLESEGIPAYLPDANIKRVDPFITGAGALATNLQVPRSRAEEAGTLVAEYLEATRRPAEPGAPGDEEAQLEHLGTRARWAALTVVLAPFAIVLGILYLVKARRLGVRPPAHALTLTSTVYWLAVLALVIAFGVALLVVPFGVWG